MFVSSRIAANAMLFAASVGAGAAMAQQPAPQSANAPKAAASSAASATAAPVSASLMAYRSAFEGYKGLTEQPVQPWRESNDTVGRIGGWQSYAREGQGGPVAGSAPLSAPKGTGNTSGVPGDHGGMKMPSTGSDAARPMAPAATTQGAEKALVRVPPQKIKAPGASASMPADHMRKMKP